MTEFDDETLAIMKSYCGCDPRIPRAVTRTPLRKYAAQEWTLGEFTMLLARTTATIPEDKRDGARVVLEGGYDEGCCLKIVYADVETPEEVAENVRRALNYARQKQAEERREFARLKAKFKMRSTMA